MNQSIIELLSEDNNFYTKKEIKQILGIDDFELESSLKELEETGLIYHTKDDKYTLFSNSKLLKGMLEIRKDKLYVNTENGYIEIKDSKIDDLRVYDFVAVAVEKNDSFGKVIKVLKKNERPIASELLSDKGKNYVIDEMSVSKKKILIKVDETKCASLGHIVLVKDGVIKKVLGHINAPDMEITQTLYKYGFDPNYSKEVMEEIENDIPDHIDIKDYPDFIDLRDMSMITIDCDSTKDIDDGCYAEKIDNETIKVYIPIAIETEFIKEGSAIEKDIFERGTSVYVEDTVCAMMHQKLSNGICSLNEGEDRLAFTLSMDIDKNGKIKNIFFFDAIVNSKKKMKYSDVNLILEENIIPSGYEEYVEEIKLLNIASKWYCNKLMRDGFLDFASRESKLIYEKDKTNPLGINIQYQKSAERLIEFLALAHNSTLASYLTHQGVNCVFRVDDKSNQEKLKKAFECYIAKGYFGREKKYYNAKDIQKVLANCKGNFDEYAMSSLGIRAQSRAKFSEKNTGHFPTSIKCYAQESSGIRRAGDFVNQRIARTVKKHGAEYARKKYNKDFLAALAIRFTNQELLADKCEREIHNKRLALYMENQIGEEFEGVIVGFVDSGMFVELQNTVEGFIPFSSMKDDNYIYSNGDIRAYGRYTKKIYMYGDPVTVKLVKTNPQNGNVDFELANTLILENNDVKKRIKSCKE